MQFITDLYRAIREIWKGSGIISAWSIAITTLSLYIAFTLTANSNLFLLLLKFKGIEDFRNKESYLSFLENIHIDEINIFIPIICTLLLLIYPLKHIKSNISNRLLPISPIARITALGITIILITWTSTFLVYLLDESIIYYIRRAHLAETISLQESFGDLYRSIPDNRILATDFVYGTITPQSIAVITFLSLITNILFIIIGLLFHRYSIIKGLVLIIAVVATGVLLRDKIQDSLSPHTVMAVDIDLRWSHTLYPYLLLLSLVSGLYYLLKEREE